MSTYAQAWREYWETCEERFAHLDGQDRHFDRQLAACGVTPEFLTGKTVLDYGCGPGQFADFAAEHGAERYIGLDIAERALATARGQVREIPCYWFLTSARPLSSYAADVLVSFAVIQHFPTEGHLDAVAYNFDTSGIPALLLQHRWGQALEITDHPIQACRLPASHLATLLPRYRLIYASPVVTANYQYTRWELR